MESEDLLVVGAVGLLLTAAYFGLRGQSTGSDTTQDVTGDTSTGVDSNTPVLSDPTYNPDTYGDGTYTPITTTTPTQTTATTVSPSGVAFTKTMEGLKLTKYPDGAGYSIGYGHFIKPGEIFGTITQPQAVALFNSDAAPVIAAIKTNVHVPLTQNEFDALFDLVYDIGVSVFTTSTLLQKLNTGDYTGAANEINRWIYSNGVVNQTLANRRAQEKAMFLLNAIA